MTARISKTTIATTIFARRPHSSFTSYSSDRWPPLPTRKSAATISSGNLVVSRSVYDNNPNNIAVDATLPPNCATTLGGCSPGAVNDGTYPQVWNNNLSDRQFRHHLTKSSSTRSPRQAPW